MRANRLDANHSLIVAYFKKFECSVLNISALKNCGDILIAKNSKTVIIEIKDGSKPPSARKLTKGERGFAAKWQGIYTVVYDLSDVIAVVQALEK